MPLADGRPTRDEFAARYRHTLLGLMAEAWGCRKLAPSEFGMLMDGQMIRVRAMLGEMYDVMNPPPRPAAPVGNGKPVQAEKGKVTT